MTLEEKAELIAIELEIELRRIGKVPTPPEEERASIDPFTIGIILTILIELVKLYMACNSEAGAVKSLASPSWWQRLLMRRTIKRKIRETKLRGLDEEIEVAFLKSGKETTVSEMEGFYAEVRESK